VARPASSAKSAATAAHPKPQLRRTIISDVYDADWKLELKTLIEQARVERKWLFCSYQGLWFSPDQLEQAHREGRFMWGAVNWQLRDPSEQLAAAERKVREATAERDRIAAGMPQY